jgi:sulfur-carrier protein
MTQQTLRSTTRVSIAIPAALARLFPESVRYSEVEAATVGAAIDALDARWPGMRDRICDSRPAIRQHINVFVNGHQASLDTPLSNHDEVLVMTAISGG